MALSLLLRKRANIALAAGVALLLVTAGCGDATTGAAADLTTTSTGSTIPVAAPGQYASIISEHTSDIQDDILTSLRCFDSFADHCSLDVGLASDAVQKAAVHLHFDLSRASNPRYGDDFVGLPPPELAALVDRTISAADQVHRAMAGFNGEGCITLRPTDTPGANCSSILERANHAFQEFKSTLAAWQPYL